MVKQPLPVINVDARLKDIVRACPEQFLRYFLPTVAALVDFSRGAIFLDKELQHLLPGWSKKGQRTGDLLMQWFLLDGRPQFVLAHIEFQHNPKAGFSRRVFVTSVRVTDKYPDCELAQLVLYTGEHVPKDFNFYEVKFLTGKTRHEFEAYIVRDKKREVLEASDNMFALVVLACLSNIEQKKRYKDDYDWLAKQKTQLVRLCLGKGFSKQEIEQLLIFVAFIIALPNEMEEIFEEQVRITIMKKESTLQEDYPRMWEFFERLTFEGKTWKEQKAILLADSDAQIKELKAQARAERAESKRAWAEAERVRAESERVRAEANAEANRHIILMHQKGFSPAAIADLLEKDLFYVESIIAAQSKP